MHAINQAKTFKNSKTQLKFTGQDPKQLIWHFCFFLNPDALFNPGALFFNVLTLKTSSNYLYFEMKISIYRCDVHLEKMYLFIRAKKLAFRSNRYCALNEGRK